MNSIAYRGTRAVAPLRLLALIATAAMLAVSADRAAAEAHGAEPQIELLLGDVSMNKLPFIMALDDGIYARNGLDVVPKFTAGSVEIIRKSGVDVPDEYIASRSARPLVKIGGATPHLTRLVMTAGAWDPLILGSTHAESRWRIVGQPELEGPQDLKGKRIGYSGVGAVTHYMAVSFAEHMGWDPYFDWSMMGNALGVESLEAGHVDAIIAPELHATMAVDAGYKILADLGEYNLPVAGSSFLFDREWIKDNEDTARRLIKSYVEAIALLKTDKEATFRTLRKWFQITDDALLEHFYREAEKLPSKPYSPVAGLKKMMQIYDSHEMRKYTVDYFYDDSYIRELDESGYIDSLYE